MKVLRHCGYLILPLALLLVGCSAAAPPAPTPSATPVPKPAGTAAPNPAGTAAPRPAAAPAGPPATPVALPTPQAVGSAAKQWDQSGHYHKGNPTARVVLEEWTSIQ